MMNMRSFSERSSRIQRRGISFPARWDQKASMEGFGPRETRGRACHLLRQDETRRDLDAHSLREECRRRHPGSHFEEDQGRNRCLAESAKLEWKSFKGSLKSSGENTVALSTCRQCRRSGKGLASPKGNLLSCSESRSAHCRSGNRDAALRQARRGRFYESPQTTLKPSLTLPEGSFQSPRPRVYWFNPRSAGLRPNSFV